MMYSGHYYTNLDMNVTGRTFLNSICNQEEITADQLYPLVDVYANTQITDILFNIFIQYSQTDTQFWSTYADKYEQKDENGVSVDYTDRFIGPYTCARKWGIDPFKVWFSRCREQGMHPWISIRMNDCHLPDQKASYLRSDFFYTAREKGWMVGEKYGYYRHCYDYAVPQVRQRMIDYIGEQLHRYDVDGLELDFLREIICFDYLENRDAAAIMTGFMREIKAIVAREEIYHGHKIRIGVRLMRDIAQNLAFGMDAEAWVREGLVDLIAVCPRWESCDSDMPIDQWKAAFPQVEIAAGLEIMTRRCQEMKGLASPAVMGGYAIRYLGNGADSMYLFNYMIQLDKMILPDYPLCAASITKINQVCGRAETILQGPLRYIVTYQDLAPQGQKAWNPLPMALENAMQKFGVQLGFCPFGRKMALILGFAAGTPKQAEIRINGQICSSWQPCDRGVVDQEIPNLYAGKNANLYRAEFASSEQNEVVLEFRLGQDAENVVISYAEIETWNESK